MVNVNVRDAIERWDQPVIQTCGHTTEAKKFREDVLSQAEGVHCGTCDAPVAPWAPRNHALVTPTHTEVPAAWRDVIRPVPVAAAAVRNAARGVYQVHLYQADDQAVYEGYTAILQAIDGGPRFENILVKRSAVSERLGHIEAALTDLSTACRLDPARAWEHAATLRRLTDAAAPVPPRQPVLPASDLPAGFGDCVLTAEQMYDPVSLSCGHTFERESLFRTRRPFFCSSCQNPAVSWHIPNLALRHILDDVIGEPSVDRPRAGLRLDDGLPASAFDVKSVMEDAHRLVGEVEDEVAAHPMAAADAPRLQAWLHKLDEALAVYPYAPAARFLRARVLATLGRTAEACESFDDGVRGFGAAPYGAFVESLYKGGGLRAVLSYLSKNIPDEKARAAIGPVLLQRFEAQLSNPEGWETMPELFAAALQYSRDSEVLRAAWEGIRALGLTDLSRLCGTDNLTLRKKLLQYVADAGEYTEEAIKMAWGPGRYVDEGAPWMKIRCHHLRKCNLPQALALMVDLLESVRDALSPHERIIRSIDTSKPFSPASLSLPPAVANYYREAARSDQRKLVQKAASELSLRLADAHMVKQAESFLAALEHFLPEASEPLASWLKLTDLAERPFKLTNKEIDAFVSHAKRVGDASGQAWKQRLEDARDAVRDRYPPTKGILGAAVGLFHQLTQRSA